MKRLRIPNVWHFAMAIRVMTLAIVIHVILAMPAIGVLHAPPVIQSNGSVVP